MTTTQKPDGGPAYPVSAIDGFAEPGMTLREHAAITLRVPDSGTDWLDEMILQAKRDDFAAQALAAQTLGEANVQWIEQYGAKNAYRIADAMIAERDAG